MMTLPDDKEWWIPCEFCDEDGGRFVTEAEYKQYQAARKVAEDGEPSADYYVTDAAGQRVPLREALEALGLMSDGGK